MNEQEWLASSNPREMLEYLCKRPSSVPREQFVPIATPRKMRLFSIAVFRRRTSAARPSPMEAEWAEVIRLAEALADDDETPLPAIRPRVGEEDFYPLRDDAFAGAFAMCDSWGENGAWQAAVVREILPNPFRPCPMTRIKATGPGAANNPPYRRAYREHAKAWLTPDVRSIAAACYGARLPSGELDPQRLAVLSDALVEAGCADEAILRHLRGEEVCPQCLGTLHYRHPVASQSMQHCTLCWDDDAGGGRGWPTGWIKLRGPHVRGCWTLDVLLGKG